MTKQLTLIGGSRRARPPAWRLDEATRETGRKGLVEARAALTQARRRSQARAGSGPPAPRGARGARDRPAA